MLHAPKWDARLATFWCILQGCRLLAGVNLVVPWPGSVKRHCQERSGFDGIGRFGEGIHAIWHNYKLGGSTDAAFFLRKGKWYVCGSQRSI